MTLQFNRIRQHEQNHVRNALEASYWVSKMAVATEVCVCVFKIPFSK